MRGWSWGWMSWLRVLEDKGLGMSVGLGVEVEGGGGNDRFV